MFPTIYRESPVVGTGEEQVCGLPQRVACGMSSSEVFCYRCFATRNSSARLAGSRDRWRRPVVRCVKSDSASAFAVDSAVAVGERAETRACWSSRRRLRIGFGVSSGPCGGGFADDGEDVLRPPEPAAQCCCDRWGHEGAHDEGVDEQTHADGGA